MDRREWDTLNEAAARLATQRVPEGCDCPPVNLLREGAPPYCDWCIEYLYILAHPEEQEL